jgi:hypothetical protein
MNGFQNEAACGEYPGMKHQEEGIVCENCHQANHHWYMVQKMWKCKTCGTWLNLKSGTMMEKTKILLMIWFEVIHLLTSTKKAFSALEIYRQIENKFYEPVWFIMQKIRLTMGKRDARYNSRGCN